MKPITSKALDKPANYPFNDPADGLDKYVLIPHLYRRPNGIDEGWVGVRIMQGGFISPYFNDITPIFYDTKEECQQACTQHNCQYWTVAEVFDIVDWSINSEPEGDDTHS